MSSAQETTGGGAGRTVLTVVVWLWVLIPFGYGLVMLFNRIPALFGIGG
jgi:hypothetical protein